MPRLPDLCLLFRGPEGRAEAHLRHAAHRYTGLRSEGAVSPAAIRHLEAAAALSPDPRYRLALAIARFDQFERRAFRERELMGDLLGATTPAGDGTRATGTGPSEAKWSPVPGPGEAGEDDFEEVLRREPDSAAAHFYLGVIRMRREDAVAEDHFRAAAESDRENALPLYLAAESRLRHDDPAGALSLIEEGNARPGARLYLSPLAWLGSARRPSWDGHLVMETGRLFDEMSRIVGVREGWLPADGESRVRSLLAAGRWQEVPAAAEAVWVMARNLAAIEPWNWLCVRLSGALRGEALQAMELAYAQGEDPAGLARVAAGRAAQNEAMQLLRNVLERDHAGRNERWMADNRALAGLLAGAAVLLLVWVAALPLIFRQPPGTAASLLFGAMAMGALCLSWAHRSRTRRMAALDRRGAAGVRDAIADCLARMP